MKTVQELLNEAKELIGRNGNTYRMFVQASEEERTNILIQKVYDIGFDDGYEHRKKVEVASK